MQKGRQFGVLFVVSYKSIKIENGEKKGTQKVTVVTDGSAEISKKDAVASLGDKAKRYVVVTWTKAGDDT